MEESFKDEGQRHTFPSGSKQVGGFLSTVPLLSVDSVLAVFSSHCAFTASRYFIHVILHCAKQVISTMCDESC